MSRFEIVAFDADDTLWHNERHYVEAQNRFRSLLSAYHSPEWVDERLYDAEVRNLPHFGYGVKAFALSMIETAIDLTEGRVSSNDIRTIIDTAREMLSVDVELFEHAAETLDRLSGIYPLMLITKGDLRDQERKVEKSGVGGYFRHIEIVSEKRPDDYAAVLERHGASPGSFVMVGNSLRSDVVPVLALGGSAVYVPHEVTWPHEVADPPPKGQAGYYRIAHLGELPGLLDRLENEATAEP